MSPVPNREGILAFVATMPSLPTTVSKVVEIANDVSSSVRDLVKVIRLDPVLVAKVLKVVNSSYFGQPDPVTQISSAVIMLGMNTVKNLALSTAVVAAAGKRAGGGPFDMDATWAHSVGVGVAAKLIARHLGVERRLLEQYFIAGLLHDIGKILLVTYRPQDYTRVVAAARNDDRAVRGTEQRIFGMDHAHIGALVARKWSLNEDLVAAIEDHHAPDPGDQYAPLVLMTTAADYFANKLGMGFLGGAHEVHLDPAVWRGLGLSEAQLEREALAGLPDQIERASVFLSS